MDRANEITEDQEINDRLDRLPVTRAHAKAMLMTCFGPLFEANGQSIIASVLPVVVVAFGLTLQESGLVTSAQTYGLMTGTIISGPISDRFGRRRSFILFMVWFSLMAAAQTLSFNFYSIFITLFVLGIGLGAILPIGITLIAEILPSSKRRLLPVYQSSYGIGALMAVGTSLLWATQTTVMGIAGWRFVYIVGSLPVILAVFFAFKLPESPRWLVRNGRVDEARKRVEYYEASAKRKGGTLQPVQQGVSRQGQAMKRYGYRDLLLGPYGKRTVVNATYWFTYTFMGGLMGLTTLLLVREGFSLSSALTFTVIATLLRTPGILFGAFLFGRLDRKKTILLYTCVEAVCETTTFRTLNPFVITGSLAGINFFGGGPNYALILSFFTEQYPTDIRGRASAFLSIFSRLGSAVGASFAGVVVLALGVVNTYTVAPAMVACMGLLIVLLAYETKGRPTN